MARSLRIAGSIFLKLVGLSGFAIFCYLGILALYEWGSGTSLEFARSMAGDNIVTTNPAFRWASVGFILFVLILTMGYFIFIRLRWMDILLGILHPMSLPERYTRHMEDAVDSISMASGIDTPEVLVIKDDCLNAFTLSRTGRTCTVLTRGLLASLELDELTAVVAHEFAHMQLQDVNRFYNPTSVYLDLIKAKAREREWLKLLAATLPVFLWMLVAALVVILDELAPGVEPGVVFAAIVLFIAVPFFIWFMDTRINLRIEPVTQQRAFLRERLYALSGNFYFDSDLGDFDADWTALTWTYYPEGLARALEKSHDRGYSPQLFRFDGISFVRTIPPYNSLLSRITKTEPVRDKVADRMRLIMSYETAQAGRVE